MVGMPRLEYPAVEAHAVLGRDPVHLQVEHHDKTAGGGIGGQDAALGHQRACRQIHGLAVRGHAGVLLHDAETLPEYITPEPEQFYLPSEPRRPKHPEWVTLRINRGKRDKISKGDVVGFLIQKGGLAKEELGVVEVFDSCSLAAVKRNRKPEVLARIRLEKIKNKSAKYE